MPTTLTCSGREVERMPTSRSRIRSHGCVWLDARAQEPPFERNGSKEGSGSRRGGKRVRMPATERVVFICRSSLAQAKCSAQPRYSGALDLCPSSVQTVHGTHAHSAPHSE
eukprot:7384780-Prymnesium_polylepis.1